MSEASTTATWADSWATSQQALIKTMFPVQPPGASGATNTQGPLQAQFAELRDTWQESIQKWTELVQQAPKAAPMTPGALRELFTPARWSGTGAGSFDAHLRQVLEGPKYAMLFDLDRKLLALQQLASQRDRDVAAFHAILIKAWNTAVERFSSSIPPTKSQATATWRGTADRWLAVVNDTLIEVQRSEAFVEAQRKMLRSASDYRLQERKIAEAWCEAFHVPTRTEMDEVQRTVTDLRRQLRALQRANGSSPLDNQTPASQPTKRVAAKKPRATARR
jgi:polyhydroxyalkanoate synthesis regulator phasin